MNIQNLLTYFKHNIEVLHKNKTSSPNNTVEIRLKRKEVICKHCGAVMRPHGLGREKRVTAGEDFYLSYYPLRYICPKCKKTITINPPFIEPRARITEECKEEIIKALKYRVSINEVAKRFKVSHTTVSKLLKSYKSNRNWENLGEELRLGIDEHSFRGYDTVVSIRELSSHTQLGFLYPDRKYNLKEFLRNLPVKDKVKEVSVDMKTSYINSVREELPNAKIVLDHFHIIHDANREISMAIETEAYISKMKLPRKIFFKNIENLKDDEKKKLIKTLREHPYLKPFYAVKELIRKVYRSRDKEEARKTLEMTILYGRKVKDVDLDKWIDRLTKYKEYILNYFDNHTTNAQLEGSNLVVKLIKRISFGFRNPTNYIQRLNVAFSNSF